MALELPTPVSVSAFETPFHPSGEDRAALQEIRRLLHERTGTDFTEYRAATFQRRVVNRIISTGIGGLERYSQFLRDEPDEAQHLLARITIKVSRFYRHAVTFDALRNVALPQLRSRAPLRCWSAGCGHGEEAYTLAMLLDEAGIEGTVDATDIDPFALATAQKAQFRADALEELPDELRERYLERDGDRCTVRQDIRDRVRFSVHDLLGDGGFGDEGSYDLVCCRNVLIYFERAKQERVFLSVRRTVREGGYLCLGEAEWPTAPSAVALQALAPHVRLFRATHLGTSWTTE